MFLLFAFEIFLILFEYRSNKTTSFWQYKLMLIVLFFFQQIKDELCEVVAEMEALDSQEDCKHSNKNKQMSIGRKKFNMDPKKGECSIIFAILYDPKSAKYHYRLHYTPSMKFIYFTSKPVVFLFN